mmetsp:Transcript_32099/g.37124  ORF Transcript_32099/g.37124 Transcript_32099/m.37124 type:complete len:206 (-) Transcript_32099:478-1095(-)
MIAPKKMTKTALTVTAAVVIIPNVGLALERITIIAIVPLERIIAIVLVEARDLTVNVTTVLPDLPEESAHVHGAILYRNRHGIAAAVVAGGVTIVTAVNVADVHDEVEAEAEATAAVCLPVVTKAAKIAGDAAIEITHVNGHVRNPEIRNLATEEDAGAGVPLPAKAVAVALARVTTGAAAEIRIIAMVIVKQKMMIDRNTRRTN